MQTKKLNLVRKSLSKHYKYTRYDVSHLKAYKLPNMPADEIATRFNFKVVTSEIK